MPKFGSQNFENIFTTTWLLQLEQTKDLSLVVTTLMAIDVDNVETLTSANCYRAILAAEVLAALRGHGAPNLPQTVLAWVEQKQGPISEDIIDLADQALNVIMVQSKLKEQWMRTGELDNWKKSITNLHFRLATRTNGHHRRRPSLWARLLGRN